MKKIGTLLLIIFVFCFTCNILAAPQTNIYLNGKLLKTEVEPVLKNGSIFVPFRAIAESFNCTVGFEPQTKTITMTKDNTTIQMTVNSITAYINNKKTLMDTAPIIVAGRTLVPLRFVGEALNCRVDWKESRIVNGHAEPNKCIVASQIPIKMASGDASISTSAFKNGKVIDVSDSKGKKISIGYDIMMPQFSNMQNTQFQKTLNDKFNLYSADLKSIVDVYPQFQKLDKENYTYTVWYSYEIKSERKGFLSMIAESFIPNVSNMEGNPSMEGINIDFTKSKILTLSDLFKSDSDYKTVLLKKINDLQSSAAYKDVNSNIKHLPSKGTNFYIQNDNLVIYYDTLDIADYSRGFVEFAIPLNQLTDYLN